MAIAVVCLRALLQAPQAAIVKAKPPFLHGLLKSEACLEAEQTRGLLYFLMNQSMTGLTPTKTKSWSPVQSPKTIAVLLGVADVEAISA